MASKAIVITKNGTYLSTNVAKESRYRAEEGRSLIIILLIFLNQLYAIWF